MTMIQSPLFGVFGMLIAWECSLQPLWAQEAPPSNTADRARAVGSLSPDTLLNPVTQSALQPDPTSSTLKLPGDAEYGEQRVLARRANFEPWSFSADAEYFYTDNVALASTGELEDFYLRTGAQIRYTNRVSGNWFFTAALDGHALLHEEYEVLDFLLIKGDAGAMYRVPWLADTFLSAGYSGYWISEADLTTEAFQNHAATLGLQKVWKIARAMQVVAGASTEYSLSATPEPPQRHEYSSYVGYRFRLNEKLSVAASYRIGLYAYPAIDRQDWSQVLVLGASYDLTNWARVSLSASQAWSCSSETFFDYDNRVVGTSLTFHLEF